MTGIAGQAIGLDEQLSPISESGAISASSRGSMEPFIGYFPTGSVFDPAPADFTADEDNVTAASDGTSRFSPVYSGNELSWDDVTATLPQNTVAPAVTGNPQSGSTLTCSTGTWTDADSYTFRWYKDNTPVIGQTSSTISINSTYIGSEMVCIVTATNSVGAASAESNAVTINP